MGQIMHDTIKSEAVLEFAVFCIESVAENLGKDPAEVYRAFTEKSDILNGYIVPCFEALHTQGKEYIVEELLSLLAEREVEL